MQLEEKFQINEKAKENLSAQKIDKITVKNILPEDKNLVKIGDQLGAEKDND